MQSFTCFLETENTSPVKKELQPWIPFCDSKCTFCYFPTEVFSRNGAEKYLLALKKALRMYAKTKYIRSSEFREIYFGGGTPTVLSSEQLVDLLLCCERNFSFSENQETKISGCTHNLCEKKLEALSKYGVDQLDIGVQTFDDKLRKMLNLKDSADAVEQKVKIARKMGFFVSIDLIYNLPGQSIEGWRNDLQKALKLDVESVDCYPLDVQAGTILHKQLQYGEVPPISDRDTEIRMYLEAYNFFKESGYKPACHNRFTRMDRDLEEPCFEVFGTGAGFFMGHLSKYSYVDIAPANAYINAVSRDKFPVAKLAVSSEEEQMRKMMMKLYIRLPVDKSKFRERFGKLPEEVFETAITRMEKQGLIEVNDKEIRLTKMGDVWRFNVAWEFGC